MKKEFDLIRKKDRVVTAKRSKHETGEFIPEIAYLKSLMINYSNNGMLVSFRLVNDIESADLMNEDEAAMAVAACREHQSRSVKHLKTPERDTLFSVVNVHDIRGELAGKKFGF